MTKNKKLLLIITPIVVIVLLCAALAVNFIVYNNVTDIDLLAQNGFKTNKLLSIEQISKHNNDMLNHTQIITKSRLCYGIKPYGIKAECKYNDGEDTFAFEIYEVRYSKTKIFDFEDKIVGLNKTIALKDFYVVIPNGTKVLLEKTFEDLGFHLDDCVYRDNTMQNWSMLGTI